MRAASIARRAAGGLALAALLAIATAAARAQMPPAGSVIGNAATATFVDGSGQTQTVTSNVVETIVQQVHSLTLDADRGQQATPGQTAYFPHTLTNTGNGTTTFALTAADAAGDSFDFDAGTVQIFADANGDGQPDDAIEISQITIEAGAAYNLVLAARVPATAVSANTGVLTVTAQRSGDASVTASNTDTATVTADAAIRITKSMSATSGAPSDSNAYTVTFSYENTGGAAAQNLVVTDILDSRFTYAAGSGRASLTGANALTDDATVEPATSDGTTIDYSFTSGTDTVAVTLGRVEPGNSGTISFQVTIPATPLTAAGLISNRATYAYELSDTTPIAGLGTNTVVFDVDQVAALSLADEGDGTFDQDSTVNGTVSQTSANQSVSVVFRATLANNGNSTDTFDISIANVDFPTGTTFLLLGADGLTPLVDSDGDGVPDSGPLSPGATTFVYVKAVLPPDATGATLDATLTATSSVDTTTLAAVGLQLGAIANSVVNVTGTAALGGGGAVGTAVEGPGGETTAVLSANTAPNAFVDFALFANNPLAVADNYNLTVTSALSAGWIVTFYRDADGNGVVSGGDPIITNTGTIASGNVPLIARVFVPPLAAATTVDVVFRARSPNTAAEDYIKTAVVVGTVSDAQITGGNTGQTSPGGTFVYSHTLSNEGNVVTGDITLSTSDNSAGWSSQIYIDDGDGLFDAGDALYDPASKPTLSVGGSLVLFVKVFAPAGATPGASNTSTLSVSTAAGGTASAGNTTTVISGKLTVTKTQALDSACDGEPVVNFTTSQLSAGAVSGACIQYRITATNVGSTAAQDVVITDDTPSFTTVELGAGQVTIAVTDSGGTTSQTAAPNCAGSVPGISSAPADEASGQISAAACDLPAGASATLSFAVQIDG